MYEIRVHAHFDAAHRLRNYTGKCSRLHGHTWKIEALVQGNGLDSTGMLIDFKVFKGILADVLDEFDHQCINDLPGFTDNLPDTLNPTAENIAKYIYQKMRQQIKARVPGTRLGKITVWESPGAAAAYWED
ncbi:MAG: 6-carboxytetrahydropterin synthase QueD [Bacillota bacterium]